MAGILLVAEAPLGIVQQGQPLEAARVDLPVGAHGCWVWQCDLQVAFVIRNLLIRNLEAGSVIS